jgi:hypothetical protein
MSSVSNRVSNADFVTGRTFISSIRNYLVAESIAKKTIKIINPIHAALFGAATEISFMALIHFKLFKDNFIFATSVAYIAAFVMVSSFVHIPAAAAIKLVITSNVLSFIMSIFLNPAYFCELGTMCLWQMIKEK